MLERALKVFAGSSNPGLARKICEYLDVPMGEANVTRFSDGELCVEIGENVRNADIFVLQSTSSPANEQIMELVIMIDALKRSSASSICAVIPYFGYGRQDRKVAPRTPITAKLVSNLIEAAGATRILAVDLHAGQIQGFFDVPFDHLFAMPVLLQDMHEHHPANESVIVSPDAGGVERARAYSKRHGSALAIIDKRRPAANVAEIMNLIGDVEGRDAIMIDDMVDTAGTLANAATALTANGARKVVAYATHGVLSGPAIQRIEESPIEKLVVTDTIQLHERARACEKIQVRSVAPLLAKALRRIHQGDSVSSLFV
jgi:ribose-phosphate pyrophosphokinase